MELYCCIDIYVRHCHVLQRRCTLLLRCCSVVAPLLCEEVRSGVSFAVAFVKLFLVRLLAAVLVGLLLMVCSWFVGASLAGR